MNCRRCTYLGAYAILTMSFAVFPLLKTSENRKTDLLKAIEDA